jgi:hypothetical protein
MQSVPLYAAFLFDLHSAILGWLLAAVQPKKAASAAQYLNNQRNKEKGIYWFLNPLPDGPRSNRPYGFQRNTAQSIKELKIWKKLQLSDDILTLFYNIRNFHIWPSLIAISFQSQNQCHNKSKALNWRPPRDLT